MDITGGKVEISKADKYGQCNFCHSSDYVSEFKGKGRQTVVTICFPCANDVYLLSAIEHNEKLRADTREG